MEDPVGISPKKLPPVTLVGEFRMKSSPVSVSSTPPVLGLESAPNKPSGVPVFTMTSATAVAERDSRSPMLNVAIVGILVITCLLAWKYDTTEYKPLQKCTGT